MMTVTGRNLTEMRVDYKAKYLEPFRKGWGHKSLRGASSPAAWIVQILQFRLDNARGKLIREEPKT